MIRRVFVVLIFFLCTYYTLRNFSQVSYVFTWLIKRSGPTLDGEVETIFFGPKSKPITFRVSDSQVGFSDFEISLEVETQEKLLARYQGDFEESEFALSFEQLPEDIEEGTYELNVKAVDNSLWKNSSAQKRRLSIDNTDPGLVILNRHFNGWEGGALMVAFEVSEPNISSAEVRINEKLFPAYVVYKDEKKRIHRLLSLFSLPIDQEITQALIHVKDYAGNVATEFLPLRLKPLNQKNNSINLSKDFVNKKIPVLFSDLERDSNKSSEGSNPQKFSVLNEKFRKESYAKVREICKVSNPQRLWGDFFQKPLPSATTSVYGTARRYFYQGQDLGSSVHYGLDLASVRAAKVLPASEGKVVFVGTIGIYGKTVVIDHGLGLHSLYSHLSSTSVSKGEVVSLDTIIGRTGKTGFAAGDHLHFEFRVNGHPVNPIEWWDPNWVKTRIDSVYDLALK